MKTKIKLAIFVAFQPLLFMFDRFIYTFLYINGFDFIQMGIIEVIYSLMSVLLLFLIGNYADSMGRKKIVSLTMGFYAILPLLYVRFRNFLCSTLVRFIDSFKHPYFPVYVSITQDLSPKKEQGKYFDDNPEKLSGEFSLRNYARIGAGFLVFGFALQMVGNLM